MKIFITGISRGLGRAIAEEALAAGHRVIGISRRPPAGDVLEAAMTAGRCLWFSCDLRDASAVESVLARLKLPENQPDVVILNAGASPDPSNGPTCAAMAETFAVNVIGAMVWIEGLIAGDSPAPVRQVIYISSAAVFNRNRIPNLAYSMSKYVGTRAICRLRPRYPRVQFTVVYPGFIDTDMLGRISIPRWMKYTTHRAAKKVLSTVGTNRRFVPVSRRGILAGLLFSLLPPQAARLVMKPRRRDS